jgi:UDP-N-acetylglucosamine pyrophosphorylase
MQNPSANEYLQEAIDRSECLLLQFPPKMKIQEKVFLAASLIEVKEAFDSYPVVKSFLKHSGEESNFCFSLLVLLGQFSHVMEGFSSIQQPLSLLEEMSSLLVECERFYEPMGGLLGYYHQTLRLISEQKNGDVSDEYCSTEYSEPPFNDFRNESQIVKKRVDRGLEELLSTAEVYTVGGAGERLGLIDPVTKESLPVANLLFLGRSMLENLFRDVEAREYFYEKTFHVPLSVPIVLMTSKEQGNDRKIESLLEQQGYFRKSKEQIKRVIQPLVPLFDLEGNFALKAPLTLLVKPGGHGVLWRLMYLRGVFDWLQVKKIQHLVIRQINNPLGGIDSALLGLVGVGSLENQLFGFASCPRMEGMAEGVNVLKERCEKSALSNLEYTSFGAIEKKNPTFFTHQTFFANTNMLYANVQSMKELSQQVVAPGPIVNKKSDFSLLEKGQLVRKAACRLESTMQNIADYIQTPCKEKLKTFLNVHDRRQLFSVTKRSFSSLQSPLETPEYCLYDWYKMTLHLMQEIGVKDLPEEQTFERFFQEGPNFLFRFHPALGPLWASMREKMRGLSFYPFAELEVELADVMIHSLKLEGSLCVRSSLPCGLKGKPESVPRFFCSEASFKNKGLYRPQTLKDILQGSLKHEEKVEFLLEEGSELNIQNVALEGSFSFSVPAYTRVWIEQDSSTKKLKIKREKKACF